MPRPDSVVTNSIMLQALMSSQEVMGANGLQAVLRASGLERFIDNMPPNDLDASVKSSEYALNPTQNTTMPPSGRVQRRI